MSFLGIKFASFAINCGGISYDMANNREEEGNNNEVVDEMVYVVVSKELKACKSTLIWALENTNAKKLRKWVNVEWKNISIVLKSYVMFKGGRRFPISSLAEDEVMAHHEKERRHMFNMLDEYVCLCTKARVPAEKLYIEMKIVVAHNSEQH